MHSKGFISNNLKDNINILIEIRDNAIHLLNRSSNIKEKLYSICAASIKNYVKIFDMWFNNIKIDQYNFFITLLNFDTAIKNYDTLSTSVAERNLLNYLELAVNSSYEGDDFDIDITKFTQKPIDNEILMRSLIDGSDEKYIDGGFINFDAANPNKMIVEELRNKSEIDYEKNNELLFKLISQVTKSFEEKYGMDGMKNIVMMYKRELAIEIYSQMMKHFVRNEGIIKEEVFADKPRNLQSNYTYNIIKDIFEPYNSDRDGRITSVLFDGIKNGVFSSAKFDGEPELLLARQLERETDFVKTWLRPSPNEFNITYNNGRKYEPDFVVETESIVYLVEVKADNQLEDEDVIAKEKRAISYCELVSKWADDTNNKKWKYVLIPASRIIANSTFKHLADQYSK